MAGSKRAVSGHTRKRIMSLLLKHGPVSASELGDALGMSAAGVRRHLDKLVESDLAETCEPHAVAGEEAARGRPAKHYRLTDSGRAHFGSSYGTLAVDALSVIRNLGGEEAVRSFARGRIEKILHSLDPLEDDASESALERAILELADVFAEHGYEATVTRAGAGIQICQHHCPVSQVASAHPEICEAEHEVISQLVGRHVQPLAVIADGNGVCTTNIPLATSATVARQVSERSGD